MKQEHENWLKNNGFTWNAIMNGYYKLNTLEEYLIVRTKEDETKFQALKIRLCEKAGESPLCDSPEEAVKSIKQQENQNGTR